jgi:hypothetical protein
MMGYLELDAGLVADRLDIPLKEWAGNCHGISEAILDRPEVLGDVLPSGAKLRLMRGHYLGQIAEQSFFGYVRKAFPFVQHSWLQAFGMVLMPEPDLPPYDFVSPLDPYRVLSMLPAINDPIIDPTRFAFDGRSPYIYIGPSDDGDYDPGGNVLREFTAGECPPFNLEKHIPLPTLPAATEHWISREIAGKGYPYGYYTYALCMWLANLPLRRLGQHAHPIFSALVAAGLTATIPMDNRMLVLGS